MPFVSLAMIGIGTVSTLMLVLLLWGDATAPGRLPLAVLAWLALTGVGLLLGGLLLQGPRRHRHGGDQRS